MLDKHPVGFDYSTKSHSVCGYIYLYVCFVKTLDSKVLDYIPKSHSYSKFLYFVMLLYLALWAMWNSVLRVLIALWFSVLTVTCFRLCSILTHSSSLEHVYIVTCSSVDLFTN